MSQTKKWYVAYVRLFHERKTAEKLAAMGIESFVPIREEIHQWSQRKKKVKRISANSLTVKFKIGILDTL